MAFSLETALKHRVVMLGGEEHELRRRSLSALLEAVSPEPDDFDREEFDGGASLPIDWASSAGTAPFLSPKRTAVVRHLLRCDPIDKADKGERSDPFKGLPETALVILVADDETGDEDRQARYQKLRAEWTKVVKSAGGWAENFESEVKNLGSSLRGEAERLGKKLSPAAAEILIEMTGSSFSRAVDELEKVAIFVGDRPEVREADIREIVVPSREWNVFVLVDSLLAGEVSEGLRQLQIVVGSQKKAEDAAMRNILPQMHRNLRLLWQARTFLDAGVSLAAPTESLRAVLPEKNNLLKEKDWVQQKILRSARRVSLDQIAHCLEVIVQTDARLKGMLDDAFAPMDTLERMVMEIAGIVSSPAMR